MVADFEKANPDAKIKAIYTGTYQESITKAMTALKSGEPPNLAVPAVDGHVHADRRGCDPALDQLATGTADKSWLGSFYPASWRTARRAERSGAFRSSARPSSNTGTGSVQGGRLDPERPPTSWAEMVEFGQKLTKA